jgi:hypothetical protein
MACTVRRQSGCRLSSPARVRPVGHNPTPGDAINSRLGCAKVGDRPRPETAFVSASQLTNGLLAVVEAEESLPKGHIASARVRGTSRRCAPAPFPVPGCGACRPTCARNLDGGSCSYDSAGGTLDRKVGRRSSGFVGAAPSSSCLRISRPSTSARSDGTAFPTCRWTDTRVPKTFTLSGNVCNRHSSRALSRRLFQWKGPIAGPGCA